MEQTTQNKTKGWARSWWTRAVAAFLAVAMTASIVLLNAAQVKLGGDDASASTGVLSETTDYVQKSAVSRAGDVLSSLVTNPQTLEQYYRNASVQIGEAKYTEALASIEKCISLASKDDWTLLDELWLKRGALETLTGAYDEAMDSFTHITLGAYRGEQLLIKAQIFNEQDNTRAACGMLHEYVRLYPDDLETRMTLAASYVQITEYDAALEQYDAVIAAGGDTDGTAYMQRATARMMAGKYEDSISDFLAAKSAGYADPSACLAQCALASYLLQNYTGVLGYGARAIELGSENFTYETLYYYMGLSQLNLGDYTAAAELLTKSIDQGITMDDAYYYRGACYMVNGSMAEAIADFTIVINRNTADFLTNSYFNRAVCEADQKEYDLAKSDLETVLRLEPENSELYKSAQAMLDLL